MKTRAHLPSARLRKFRGYLFMLARASHDGLRVIVADKRNSLTFRAAALRVLIAWAPLQVTQGQPFPVRRRLVRAHHNI